MLIKKLLERGVFLMPAMGLEPIRCCHQQILSLPRLPIPTHRPLTNEIDYIMPMTFCQGISFAVYARSILRQGLSLI